MENLQKRHPLPDGGEPFVTPKRRQAQKQAAIEMEAEKWLLENAVARENTVSELLRRFVDLHLKRNDG